MKNREIDVNKVMKTEISMNDKNDAIVIDEMVISQLSKRKLFITTTRVDALKLNHNAKEEKSNQDKRIIVIK